MPFLQHESKDIPEIRVDDQTSGKAVSQSEPKKGKDRKEEKPNRTSEIEGAIKGMGA